MASTKLLVTGTKLLAGAAVLGQLMSLSTQANATAFSYSAVQVTNFRLTNEFGGFSSFEFTSQPLSTTLNGVTVNSPSILTSTTSGATLNQIQIVQGTAPFAADNSYFGANRPTLLTPATNYAVADSNMSNTLILGAPGGVFGTQSGAQVSGGTAGAASTGTLNSLSWTFNVSADELAAVDGTPGVVHLAWSLDTIRNEHIQTTLAGETARATLSLSANILEAGDAIDSTTYIAPVPKFLSAGASPGSAGAVGETPQSFTGAFDIDHVGTFTFNILFDSSAQVSSVAVPEPGTLGLIGLGLIGLGAAYRRKNAA